MNPTRFIAATFAATSPGRTSNCTQAPMKSRSEAVDTRAG